MRAHVKKKLFRQWVHEQVKAGKVNTPDGSWRNADPSKDTDRSLTAGHRAN